MIILIHNIINIPLKDEGNDTLDPFNVFFTQNNNCFLQEEEC